MASVHKNTEKPLEKRDVSLQHAQTKAICFMHVAIFRLEIDRSVIVMKG